MGNDVGTGFIAAVLAGSYLLGSIPFGLLLTRIAGLGDIRQIGSGNIGATNVLRTGNKLIALLTVICDIAKGLAPVLIVKTLSPDAPQLATGAALFAVLGHLFPVWLKFKGGKGLATLGGALFGLAWPAALLGLATWLAVAAWFRYSSLAALVAIALSPFYVWYFSGLTLALAIAVMGALVAQRHHANIRRLLRGEESKIELKKGTAK